MKAKLLLLCMALTSVLAFSQTTVSIPDDALETYMETEFAANIVSDGSTTDGSITFADINLVTDIDLPTAGVTTVADLTGINQFPKLKNLYCQGNAVTGAVDLSGLNLLTNFYCYDNTGLTALDFTGCTKLYHLKAYNCGLTTLDLSNATLNAGADPTRLRYVYVNDNQLTSVNISGNTGIYRYDVYNNNLTSIDITGLTTLTHLRFQNNDVVGDLDVSANSVLATLGTYNNDNLTSIDLGSIPYTNFTYFKTSSSDNLSCIITDNPSDFEPGGPLETAIGSNYSVDAFTNFVPDTATCSTLSVADMDTLQFNLYPNPSRDEITLQLEEEARYELVGLNGNLIKWGVLKVGNNKLDISNLSNGMYFIKLTTNKGQFFTRKLVKK